MKFCPTCGNMLLAEHADSTGMRFYCQACPYIHNIYNETGDLLPLRRKKVDDILGGADEWKNVDQTEATCPKCNNDRAYFMQIQIRSADEPMTSFYKCTKPECGFRWKEN
eukprot:TRINITY_DN2276_c0_g2_i1.p1 TRINITY_DN2276_c0_g2~~TRINITY_DN2276_c0_g2_i1.p1  ORF type:complete len:110 (-),score=6.78 TRINITY_DN2276_c0_g2_i1:316-645(-)